MDLRITRTVLLHALGSLYEIAKGRSYTQRKLLGPARKPSEAEAKLLIEQAVRSI